MSASPEKQKFAVFDIDGTLFRSHLYWEVVLAMARSELLHPRLNKRTLDLYDAWKRRVSKLAFEDFDKETITAIDELFIEFDPSVYDKIMNRVLPPLLDQTYFYTKELLERLKKEGYFTLALSGSRIEEVTIFAKYHGFHDWIGQEYKRSKDGTRYTGETFKTYKDKHIILESFVQKHNLTYEGSYGVGDTGSDISMLQTVTHPIAFNPNRQLLEHAKQNKWQIVVERKSIAYTLEAHGDGYVLAAAD